MNKKQRPSWDKFFIEMLDTIAARSTCDRGKPACILVKDNHIISTGYAGSPPGLPHCDDAGHIIKTVTHEDGSQTEHCVRTVHAEQNAICIELLVEPPRI
jgi:dCMP deaminase